MSHSLLAMNRGSSSVKFALFKYGAEPAPMTRGTIEVSDHHVMARSVLDQIESNLREASQTLERALSQLLHSGLVTEREARARSLYPQEIG